MSLRFAVLAAALCGLLFATASANADTVTYTTSFELTSGAGTGTDTAHLGLATFKLQGVTNTVTTPAFGAPFGSIVYSGNGESNPLSGTFGFKFTVTQVSPAGSAFSLGNQFFGSVVLSGGIANVDFISGPPLAIGRLRYQPQDTSAVFLAPSGSAPITGTVTAVPLPTAAWAGLALCGVIGAGKLCRRGESEV